MTTCEECGNDVSTLRDIEIPAEFEGSNKKYIKKVCLFCLPTLTNLITYYNQDNDETTDSKLIIETDNAEYGIIYIPRYPK